MLIFILYKQKKIETRLVSPQHSGNYYFGIKPRTFLSTNWKNQPLVKWTAKCFFIGVAVKIVVLVSSRTTPVYLC